MGMEAKTDRQGKSLAGLRSLPTGTSGDFRARARAVSRGPDTGKPAPADGNTGRGEPGGSIAAGPAESGTIVTTTAEASAGASNGGLATPVIDGPPQILRRAECPRCKSVDIRTHTYRRSDHLIEFEGRKRRAQIRFCDCRQCHHGFKITVI